MCEGIASQLIGDDFPRFITVILEQPFEEALCSCTGASRLQQYIDNFAILIYSSPQMRLLTIIFHKHFVNMTLTIVVRYFGTLIWRQCIKAYERW